MKGQLYIIGTPIGNLADLSRRAAETLGSVDTLFCEDTRVSSRLLAHLGISLPLRALSDDHGQQRWDEAVRLVLEGRRIGYVSDAGMPGISDPVRKLTRAAWAAGIAPVVIPGPSSVSMLAAACPFISSGFRFAGFVPRRGQERESYIKSILNAPEPVFVFEAPQRVHAMLDELCALLEPSREILIGRELTKMYEQLLLLTAGEWPLRKQDLTARGELSIAIAAAPPAEEGPGETAIAAALARLRDRGFSSKDAVTAISAVYELSPNEIKKLAYGDSQGKTKGD